MSNTQHSITYSNDRTNAFRNYTRVVLALVLRDIKTRAGASYFGFLLGLAMPLGHIGIMLLVYVMLGRKSPIGTDVILFLSSAILPFIIWSYTHQKMIASFSQNRALMAFPIVGIIEIASARAVVELLSSVLIVIIVSIFIWISGSDMSFYDARILILCLILSYLFGIATGFVFGILSLINEFLAVIGFLLVPLFWITCGAFFVPDGLPAVVRKYLSLFSITHIVDLARMAIYPGYFSDFPSLSVIFVTTLANLLLALLLVWLLRTKLNSQ